MEFQESRGEQREWRKGLRKKVKAEGKAQKMGEHGVIIHRQVHPLKF